MAFSMKIFVYFGCFHDKVVDFLCSSLAQIENTRIQEIQKNVWNSRKKFDFWKFKTEFCSNLEGKFLR